MSVNDKPAIRVTKPRGVIELDGAKAVHANYEIGYSEIDGSRQREGGVRLELGDQLPMEDGYPPQCWKVVDFAAEGVIVVADFYEDDHVMDYDSFEIEQRNYTVLPWDKAEELKG